MKASSKQAAKLSGPDILAKFEAIGFSSAAFIIDDNPKFCAGVTTDKLPEYGTNETLDALTDSLESDISVMGELLFTGEYTPNAI